MKVFLNAYTICFCLFCIAMAALSFKRYHRGVFSGYLILCALAFISVLGYGAVPISADLLFAANDLLHLAITILLLAGAVSGLFLIGNGYRTKERLRNTGRIVLILASAYVLLYLWHVLAILSGSHILGLIQRLTSLCSIVYVFHLHDIRLPEKIARFIDFADTDKPRVRSFSFSCALSFIFALKP
jgi:hypothetical protein